MAAPTSLPSSSGNHIGIDELIALNDEIVALSRSDVPIGRGLLDLGADMPRRLRDAAERIGTRLERGERLDEVIRDESGLPPVYRAVVSAGIASGRLPDALERLSSTLRRLVEVRRLVMLASVYPLTLFLLACFLMSFIGAPLLSSIRDSFDAQGLSIPPSASMLLAFGLAAGPYAVWIGLVVGLAVLGWLVASRFQVASQLGTVRFSGWIPGVRRILNTGRTTAFLETLRVLVAHDVAFDRAIQLAADATGDPRLQQDAKQIGVSIRQGDTTLTDKRLHAIPPLVRWMLLTNQSQKDLIRGIDAMAKVYAERTELIGEALRTLLPAWLTIVVGATVTIGYITVIALPWGSMIHQLLTSP